MRTERPVEARRAAATDAVPPQAIDGLVPNPLVSGQAGEVLAGEVEHDLATLERHGVDRVVGVLAVRGEDDARARTDGTDDDGWEGLLLPWGEQRFWCPICDELVDLLQSERKATRELVLRRRTRPPNLILL